MNSRYVEWKKKQGVPLFKAGNMYWMLKQRVLVPVPAHPCFVELTHDDAKALFKDSGAWFIRYSSDPCEEPIEWWYIVCDNFDIKKLSSNTRSKINRGLRKCSVKQVDTIWLANNGYECYFTAHSRYKNAKHVSEEEFRYNISEMADGPFENWGVFVEDHLVGYCQCIVDGNQVTTNVIKYNPAFLKHYSSYALINAMLNYYVVDRGITIDNGTRSVGHDTNMQNFLLKFGFRKQFCRSNIIYRPWLGFAVRRLYPFRKLISYLPNHSSVHKVQSLLFLEELRRKCNVSTL